MCYRKGAATKSILQLSRLFMVLFLALLVQGCASKQLVTEVLPLDSSMSPGLPVFYRYAFYRHMNQMASDSKMMAEGEPGQVVKQLDHTFDANIYDSLEAKGVGVFFPGYLKMSTPGIYRFKAMANDGIQVHVNGERVVYDPAVHSDRYSGVGSVTISSAGWYPLAVKYFQRKGSARLTLYWQPPGASDFEVVPANVFGHLR